MAKRKNRRSPTEYRRKMLYVWIISLFFLVLLVVLDVILVDHQINFANRALKAPVDYSKIHFEGLSIGDKVTPEILEHRVIDAEYDFFWNNIAISVDDDNIITRLGFYSSDSTDNQENSAVDIYNVIIDYRGYPIKHVSDFVTYFGYTNVKSFNRYKYLTYMDERYTVDITLMDDEIYNVVLSKK